VGDAPLGRGEDARVLVVRHRGQPVGLIIDRMAAVLPVGEDRIGTVGDAAGQPAERPEETAIDEALLAGIIRSPDGESGTVMILDTGSLIERQFGDLSRPEALPGLAGEGATSESGRAPVTAEGGRPDEIRIVSFDVAGQEFALPVEHVREILALPATVTRVPRARAHLLGVITLRDRLLPLVGLRELYGLPAADIGTGRQQRVVVVETGGEAVGVVVDGVREILRVERGRIDPVPPLLAREAEFEDVAGIARLGNGRSGEGRRLVSVLSADRMFRHGAALRAALGSAGQDGSDGEDRAMADDDVRGGGVQEGSEPFVVFRLAGAEYGLPVAAVREVLRRPETLTALPNAPEFVAGVTTLRGAALPVIDQRRLLRLPEASGAEAAQGRMVVIGAGDERADLSVGLLVDGLSGIVRVPERSIVPAPALSQAQRRLIRRVVHLDDDRMILLLDVDELLDMDLLAALLQSV
jgi:purine-binding chemotaxis protein CheW